MTASQNDHKAQAKIYFGLQKEALNSRDFKTKMLALVTIQKDVLILALDKRINDYKSQARLPWKDPDPNVLASANKCLSLLKEQSNPKVILNAIKEFLDGPGDWGLRSMKGGFIYSIINSYSMNNLIDSIEAPSKETLPIIAKQMLEYADKQLSQIPDVFFQAEKSAELKKK